MVNSFAETSIRDNLRIFARSASGTAVVSAPEDRMEDSSARPPYKILVVEDDNSMRLLLTEILGHAGYEVIAVSTLDTAMQALTTEAPDALVTDLRLDGYTGLQLVTMSPRPIPTIVVTGADDPALEHEARQLGAEYLLKPVDAPALLSILRQKLTGVPQHGEYRAVRKSPRKRVGAEVQINGAPGRLVDVSYDGLRLYIQRTGGAWLPLAFEIAFPSSNVIVPVDVVWKRRSGEASWLCGAAVSPGHRDAWRALVDDLEASDEGHADH
jgi:CheY-like chemotaxis protein